MSHDYNFPGNWHDLTDSEKNEWYHQERNRRQAIRQAEYMPYLNAMVREHERIERRAKARSETVDVEDNR